MTKRCRPEDPIDCTNFKCLRAVPVKMYNELAFLSNKSLAGNRIKQAVIIVRTNCLDGIDREASIFQESVTEPLIIQENKRFRVASEDENPDLLANIKRVISMQPVCMTFLMGLAPKMGRNESWWVEVDEDTRKRVRSPPESSVHRAFAKHELAEKQCIRLIFAFLL